MSITIEKGCISSVQLSCVYIGQKKEIMKLYILISILLCTLHNCSYEYPRLVDGYFSQKGQDKFLNEEVFKGKKTLFL